MLERLQQFDLDLAILAEALRLLDLIAQSDLHGSVSVIIFVIHGLRLVLIGGLLDGHAIVLAHRSLAIHHHLVLLHLEECGHKRTFTGLHRFLDLLTFPWELLVLSLADLRDQSAPVVLSLILVHLEELGQMIQLNLLRIGSRLRLLREVFSVDGPSLSKN